jgi:hypothetical protein
LAAEEAVDAVVLKLAAAAVVCCVQGDPYKTLFVPRLSYEVTERKLKHEFEEFGPIKRIRLVHDRNAGKALLWHYFLTYVWCASRLTPGRSEGTANHTVNPQY